MESIAPSHHEIEQVNDRLDALLESLCDSPVSFSLSADQMAAILGEVMRVGDWLRAGLARNADPVLTGQLNRYRGHLEHLRAALPGIYTRLLAERSRIQADRNHLEAAAAWAQSAAKQAR